MNVWYALCEVLNLSSYAWIDPDSIYPANLPIAGAMASQLQPLLDSIRAAVKDQNWHSALALALTLPDICARIETGQKGKRRYFKWWTDNFGDSYTYGSGPTDHVKAEEVYLLRCAYLHEGSDSLDPTDRQKLNALIEKFKFVISNDHLKKQRTTVLLNVRTFCLDMCSRVEGWEKNVLSKDPHIQERAHELSKNLFASANKRHGEDERSHHC